MPAIKFQKKAQTTPSTLAFDKRKNRTNEFERNCIIVLLEFFFNKG